jgi:Ni/Fe-hydrogenase subunit HybB-like protein
MNYAQTTRTKEVKLLTPAVFLLLLISLVGIYFLGMRYMKGIGSVSNLTDYMPWGIWKVINVIVGAALVCGGYACAFTVYIFNQAQYHRFVRPAILLSLLGYSFAGFSLFYDVGRYWGLFNFLMPRYWQGNSVLFEVGICVMSYIVILTLEIAPAILEKFITREGRLSSILKTMYTLLDKFLFLIISFGVLLPTMHQSGLGGLAVIMGQKISPLWQSPLISLHHLLSCIGMGYGCVIVTEIFLTNDYTKKKHRDLLSMLSNFMKNFIIAFLLLRFSEVLRSGAILQAFHMNLDSLSFWVEMGLFFVGIYYVRTREEQKNPKNLLLSGCFIMAAGALYRINVYIIGFHPVEGISYFPSAPELLITLGMISLQLVIFITAVKIFPIIRHHAH